MLYQRHYKEKCLTDVMLVVRELFNDVVYASLELLVSAAVKANSILAWHQQEHQDNSNQLSSVPKAKKTATRVI